MKLPVLCDGHSGIDRPNQDCKVSVTEGWRMCLSFFIVLLLSAQALAAPGWLIGFGVGVGIQIIPFTRNHVVMPTVRAVQKTVRPIPQDKIDKANRKAAKEAKKKAKQRSAMPYNSVDCDNAHGNPKLCTVEADEVVEHR